MGWALTMEALDCLLQTCSVTIEFSHRISKKSLIDDDVVERVYLYSLSSLNCFD